MIGQHSIGHVDTVQVLSSDLPRVRSTASQLYAWETRTRNVLITCTRWYLNVRCSHKVHIIHDCVRVPRSELLSKDVENRVARHGDLSGVICDKKVLMKMKLLIYQTVIRPTLLYGCETRPMSVKMKII